MRVPQAHGTYTLYVGLNLHRRRLVLSSTSPLQKKWLQKARTVITKILTRNPMIALDPPIPISLLSHRVQDYLILHYLRPGDAAWIS